MTPGHDAATQGQGGRHAQVHTHDASHGHDADEAGHGTIGSYLTGFLLSVVLTAIPFWMVMTHALTPQATALIIMAFAVAQIVVHMVCFLHLNPRSENGWNMLALAFTLVVVVIAVSGSLWVMYHMNANMMPGGVSDASGM